MLENLNRIFYVSHIYLDIIFLVYIFSPAILLFKVTTQPLTILTTRN